MAAAESGAKTFAANGDMFGAKDYQAAALAMRAALDGHQPLTGLSICPAKKPRSVVSTPSRMRGHVLVLTDSACFSSCLATLGFFERLGATLVGQTTAADTHYTNVREIVLPSGLSTFSTLQAIDPAAPLHIGPYIPAYHFDGDISDTAALERWITQTIVPALR